MTLWLVVVGSSIDKSTHKPPVATRRSFNEQFGRLCNTRNGVAAASPPPLQLLPHGHRVTPTEPIHAQCDTCSLVAAFFNGIVEGQQTSIRRLCKLLHAAFQL
jgi:hypothetical protein